jgi:hypothetical protein
VPAASDLWSGLGADQGAGLLSPAAAAPHGNGAPLGGLLLGSGVVALGGLALLAERRRVAFARRGPAPR